MNRVKPVRYHLESDERKFFDRFPYATGNAQGVIDKYKDGIVEAIGLLHKYNVPCVIASVVGNYADWEPNRSVFCGKDLDKIKFRQLMNSGNKAQERGMYAEAVTDYLKALSFCDSFAETRYRLGKCYEMLGDYEIAWQEYQRAVNNDGMPNRATEAENNLIKAIPEDGIVFTLDVVKSFRKNTEHGIIGFNLMIDWVHPNLKGYILISQLIAEKIEMIFREKKQLRLLSEEEVMDKFSINQFEMYKIYVDRGRRFTRMSTLRYDPSERLNLAELYFSRAMTIDQARYESYLGLAICSFLRKNVLQAEKYLSQAKEIDSKQVNEYVKEFWIDQVIKRAY